MSRKFFNQRRIEHLYMVSIAAVAYWLIISIAQSHTSESYQKVYLTLTQNMTRNLETIYTFEYGDTSTFDQFSNELVKIETQSEALYNNVLVNYDAYHVYLNPIPLDAVTLANKVRIEAQTFSQRLERLLSAKVSKVYSLKTLRTLKDAVLLNVTDDGTRLALFNYLDGRHTLSVLPAQLQANPDFSALVEYRNLFERVTATINDEKGKLLNSDVHTTLNEMNDYWLHRSSSAQQQITFGSVLLFVLLAGYFYWRQWVQQYREAKLNRELLLKEKERSHLAMVVEHASDAIIITDRDGNTSWVNAAFESISGYQMAEVIGKKPGSVLQGEETSIAEIKRISTELQRGNVVKSELVNYNKKGQPYWIDIVITPILDAQNKIEQFIAVERDSTERKLLAKELEKAVETADASNQAKSTFLATMSHELRTPLNGILGMAQILESSVTEHQHKQQLQILLESGNHLLSLLNDILDISKIEEGKFDLEEIDFSIEDICAPIFSTYSSLCKEKGIEFNLINQLEPGQSYRGDKSRIRQIIFNLLGNSVKFTPKGSVLITFSNSASTDSETETLIIKVQDTGVGIHKDRLNSIFDPFIQAESSTTRQFGGTGLGLTIVKQLANLMGGDVVVDSVIGSGSTFTVTLQLTPIASKEVEQKTAVSLDDQAIARSLNILLVEDNKVNAIVAKTFCTKQGHNVEVAQNGELAVTCVKNNTYDLIIMDNHMPVMDGIEATRIIRQELNCNTLIFGCTADVFKEAHDNFVDAGANLILTKPLQKESFIDALQRFRHQLMSPPTEQASLNILQLIRHDMTKMENLSATEAEIQLSNPDSSEKSIDINGIQCFKQTAEESLDSLVQAYPTGDIAAVKNILITLHSDIAELNLQLVERKILALLSLYEHEKPVSITDVQSLINLVEVNIHQAIRLLDKETHTAQLSKGKDKHNLQ
ncbi:ATP-binding protein [Vibrio sp. 10N.286.49.B1]|uniref:hybrid sensor histidine kinase/response regulator n=1 Tax=unclassified Vibrio TaxID=2614977 RepID=UPI000C81773E|nr:MULTISPECIES: PAS domain-containing hybrid sensor histidine kinase/response regulator [unclassified Vibrio]